MTDFRSGSVIVDFQLSVVVNTDVNSVYDVILLAIQNGQILSEFAIDLNSLSITDPGIYMMFNLLNPIILENKNQQANF